MNGVTETILGYRHILHYAEGKQGWIKAAVSGMTAAPARSGAATFGGYILLGLLANATAQNLPPASKPGGHHKERI